MVNKTQVYLQNIVQNISAVFSMSINLFLMALIATKSPKQLGAYKYLMIIISIHEIGYSIVDIVVSPMFHSYQSIFMVLVITKNRSLSPEVLEVLNAVFCGFFSFSLAIFALHFIYRYLVASGNKRLLSTFQSWKFFLWLSVPMFCGVSWSLLAYYLDAANEETTAFAEKSILEVLDLQTEDYVYMAAHFYEKLENGGYKINVGSLISILIMQGYITSSVIVVLVFSVKCYRRINALVSKSTPSVNAQLFQSQLFYALVTQALIPFILMHFPVGLMFSLAFLKWNIGSLTDIVSITISLYPALDPLPTIFMVKHYRKGMFDWWRWLWNKAVKASKTGDVVARRRTQSSEVS